MSDRPDLHSPVSSERHREPVDGVRVDRDVRVLAADGVPLAVDVYRPADESVGPLPALFAASPYQKDLVGLPAVPAFPWRETGPIEWYVHRGYVYVLADARGTGKSEGRWSLHGSDEQRDLYDIIEWIAEQQWSNGKVGMIGQSYFGLSQWLAAVQRPPHLTCIAPYDAYVDPYRDNAFHGGIPSSGFMTLWDMVIRGNHVFGPRGGDALDAFAVSPTDALLRHPDDDQFWKQRAAFWRLEQIDVPVLSVGNWGKGSLHLRGNILGYECVQGPKKLVVERGARPEALNVAKALVDFESIDFHAEHLAPWYDHWLKGEENGVMDEAPVRLFVSGIEAYRDLPAWPPPATSRHLYLGAGPAGAVRSLNDGALSTTEPGDEFPSTSYTYPQLEWHVGTVMVTPRGVPNPIARILTFTTPPLSDDLEVIGTPSLTLYLASDQLDTDVFVRLSDQAPSPSDFPADLPPPSNVISRGWLRASHRALDDQRSTPDRPFHTHDRAEALEPGVVHRLDIEIWPMAHVFLAGHRVRLELSCGDSPMSEGIFFHFYGVKAGTDTVHHDVMFPSHLLLPVTDR